MDLSIVVPAYGGDAELRRCLAALAAERAAGRIPSSHEIIVADDATPGGLSPEHAAAHPNVRFIIGERNLGFAGNANRGVAASAGRVLCLLNTDMYVEAGFFAGCLEAFAEDPELFAICAHIAEPGGHNDGYKELRLRGAEVELRTTSSDDPRSQAPAAVPYANGGGAFFRREAFEALGGFAEVFCPYYWEDTDLGYRAWKRGYHIRYEPQRRLEHDHQGTIGAHKRRRVKRIFRRNRRLFVWRNNTSAPLSRLVWQSCLRPALSQLARLRFRRAWEELSGLRGLAGVIAARREAYRQDRRSDAELARLWPAGLFEEPAPAQVLPDEALTMSPRGEDGC